METDPKKLLEAYKRKLSALSPEERAQVKAVVLLLTIYEIIKTYNFLTDLQISMRNENLRNHLNMINYAG